MNVQTTAAPHSKQQVLDLITKTFADRRLGKSPRTVVMGLPLFRMSWESTKPTVEHKGWRYLTLFNAQESFVVDAVTSRNTEFRFLFQRGSGRIWLQGLQNLLRRRQIKTPQFELRCLDVPAAHLSLLWLYSTDAESLFLYLHNHGQVCRKEKLRKLEEVEREIEIAIEQKLAGFSRVRLPNVNS